MIGVLYISYSFHDRAQRPRGLVPALVGHGFRPIVIHRPRASKPSPAGDETANVREAVLIPAPEPGFETLRRLSRSLRGAGRRAPSASQGYSSPLQATDVPDRRGRPERPRAERPVREIPHWFQELTAFPDRNALWIRPAVEAGLGAARRYSPRVVYASGWPVSSLVAGRRLAATLGLPLVLEFRDLWVENPFLDYTFSLRRRLDRAWEGRLLEAAAAIVVVTEPMKKALLDSHPGMEPDRIHVVPNGFDPAMTEDLAGGSGRLPEDRDAGRSPRLVYTGHLYGRRSPLPLLRAMQSLRGDGTRYQCRLRLIGRVSPDFLPALAGGEREGWVERTGMVPYVESLREIGRADGLLLLIENGRGAEGIMTGKIFPYLASGRAVLALVPQSGVAADLVRRANAGVVADPDDVQGIAEALKAWLDGSLELSSLEERQDLLHAYSWPILAGKVAGILHDVLERSRREA